MRHQTETLTIVRQRRAGRQLAASRTLLVGLLSILCWSAWLAPAWGQVAYYPLNETSGTVVTDAAGGDNNGTNSGATINQPGQVGTAYSFNGSSSVVTVPLASSANLAITSGTLTAWIRTANAGSNYRAIVIKPYAYSLFLINNQLSLFDWGAGAPRASTATLNNNVWRHVAVTFQSGVTGGTIFYVDGSQVSLNGSSTTTMTVNSLSSGYGIYIGGASVGGQNFAGQIDEVKIFNTVLAASAVCADAGRTWNGSACVAGGGGTAPSITTPPANTSVTAGNTASFSVVATGTLPLSYQWQKNNVNISGATSVGYTTPATTTADNGATYRVIVSNSAGSATSNSATLTVTTAPVAPSITTPPANTSVTAGNTASFSVVATGTLPLSYQWQKNNVNISGATSVGYTTPATTTADNGATYRVIVSNTAGSVTSASATMTVTTGGGGWQTSGSNTYYSAGNVGIGGAPSSTANLRLQVTGDVSVSGNIGAKYQDVAEWVPTPVQLPSGTVVILDMDHNNQVVASTHPYDTKVAGVVSEQPGLILGEAGEGKVMVATTGRVKVKVDASKGAIKVGDLLVTSDKPGVAMVSKPVDVSGIQMHRPGTIVGKALEPLAKGEGEILVLLSLQ